jgi:hypothetical protein
MGAQKRGGKGTLPQKSVGEKGGRTTTTNWAGWIGRGRCPFQKGKRGPSLAQAASESARGPLGGIGDFISGLPCHRPREKHGSPPIRCPSLCVPIVVPDGWSFFSSIGPFSSSFGSAAFHDPLTKSLDTVIGGMGKGAQENKNKIRVLFLDAKF